jgi:hypothetical protein
MSFYGPSSSRLDSIDNEYDSDELAGRGRGRKCRVEELQSVSKILVSESKEFSSLAELHQERVALSISRE